MNRRKALTSLLAPGLTRLPVLASPAILYDRGSAPVKFAVAEITKAQSTRPVGNLRITIAAGPEESRRTATSLGVRGLLHTEPQSYSIRVHRNGKETTIAVLSADPTGAMYGGLDIADAITNAAAGQVQDSDHTPYIAQRGIKFNIPLDLRTPSYSDNSHAAQNNIPEMWSLDFWHPFLDNMARHRFNTLSLWNLHPFPSLVKIPEFPDVALNDVWRTRVPLDDSYSHSGSDMLRPELLRDVEVVKKLTIDDKIQFWRDVMQYAHDRGIQVFWFTWNLFTFGAEGKHGITADQTNPTTIAYFRAAVREMVLTYPLLAGFGITAGERMQNLTGEFSKEKWLWKTYGLGVADAVRTQPSRQVRMIHRYHQTGHDEVTKEWKDYQGPFDLSFKYSIAHMYSSPKPPFILSALPYLSPKLRTWLTVRDDDYYSFRWGDPEFARAYIQNMPASDKVTGYYMGPDGYIWGREFLSTEPETPRQLVIDKRWYTFMIWGRLSYEPALPDDLFRRALAARFPTTDNATLFRAWSTASKIFPQITRFFWGDIDLRWQPEACLSHPRYRGFFTVKHFIEGETMPGSGIIDIVEWRSRKLAGQPVEATTPLAVADALDRYASETAQQVTALRRNQGSDKELRQTLGDLTCMSHLGHYYAAKIRGACELALFDKTSEPARREASIAHLTSALDHWKRYAGSYTAQYEQPRLYNRVGWIDIPALTAKVSEDIAMARGWKPGTIPDKLGPRPADQPFRK